MRRNLDPEPMPRRQSVIHISFPEQAAAVRSWWLIVKPDKDVDLCGIDPGFDVDLYVTADLRTMTAIWMGYDTVRRAVAEDRLHLVGDVTLARDMQTWLGLSPFASAKRLAVA